MGAERVATRAVRGARAPLMREHEGPFRRILPKDGSRVDKRASLLNLLPMRAWWEQWRAEILAATTAAVVAANLAIALATLMSMIRQWVFLGGAWPSLPWHWWGPHETVAWQLALLAGVTLAWALRRPVAQRVAFRAAAAIGALGFGVLALYGLPWAWWLGDAGAFEPMPRVWDLPLGLTLGAATLAWIAKGPATFGPGPQKARYRVMLGIASTLLVLAPSIAETVDAHRFQSFPTFRVDLVAAAPTTETAPEAVLVDGGWVELFHDDVLTIEHDDVERIRWTQEPGTNRPGITVRLDPKTAAAVRERSTTHQGRLDVIVVEGRRIMAVTHAGVLLQGEIGLFVPPDRREDLAWLYQRLTGLSAPSPTH